MGIPVAAAVGTFGLAGCYIAAMVVLRPNDPASDNEMGAGLVIFGVPTFAFRAVLVGLGFGAARAGGLIRGRVTAHRG